MVAALGSTPVVRPPPHAAEAPAYRFEAVDDGLGGALSA